MFRVFSFTLIHFLPQGIGGVCKMVVDIPKGWGVYFSGKKWKFRGGGGDLKIPEIPSMAGVWIFSGTTQ